MREFTKAAIISAAFTAALMIVVSAADAEMRKIPPLSGIVLEVKQGPAPTAEEGPISPAPDTAGTNVRCNTDTGGASQNETTIAVSPVNPNWLVGGANDYRNGEVDAGYYHSDDGGLTWNDGTLGSWGRHDAQGDPMMAVDADGNFFYGYIDFDRSSPDNGIFVAKTTNGGVTWTGPYEVIDHTNDPWADFEDKPYIAADRTNSPYRNNVYVTWTSFGWDYPIELSRSTDGGVTWSSPPTVVTSGSNQGSCPTVGPNGEVYVAWLKYGWPDRIMFDRSTDGGQTFGSDIEISEVDILPSPLPPTNFRVNSFPSLDADISGGPHNGNLYVCFADYSTGDADILFSRSTDGGTTWSSTIRLNDDAMYNGKDQFFPWLSVDNLGNVDVMWYDRRDDSGNRRLHVYWTRSTDGGVTFMPNERVTEVMSDPGNDSFIGDYNGLANHDGVAHPLWTDMRNGNEDPYTARCWTGPPPDLEVYCGPTSDIYCPGTAFLFSLTVNNNTGAEVTVSALLRVYSGYDCDFAPLVTYPRTKTYPEGSSTAYYYLRVPGNAPYGQYSAEICLTYNGVDYCCCMNFDIIDCGPW